MEKYKKRIVFVDDDANVLNALRRQLYALNDNWWMEFLSSGDAALNSLRRNPADVVISDIQMPGMSGYDFIRLVRMEFVKTVPMVLSGQMDEGLARSLVFSENHLLRKPCNRNELVGAIMDAAKRSALSSAPLRDPFSRQNIFEKTKSAPGEIFEEDKLGIKNDKLYFFLHAQNAKIISD